MSKFCKKCGAELVDEAVFCKDCGTRVEEIQQETAPANEQVEATAPAEESTACECACADCNADCEAQVAEEAKESGIAGVVNGFISKLKNKDKNTLLITAGVILSVIVLFVLTIALSGGGYEDAVDNYMKVAYKGKASLIEDLAPEAYWEYVEDKEDLKLDEIEEIYEEDAFDTMMKLLEAMIGDDVSVSYDIVDTDELSESKLDNIKDTMKERYDIPRKNVGDAIEIEIEAVLEGDEDEDEQEMTMYAVEIDGDWYACTESGRFMAEEIVSAVKSMADLKDLGSALDGLGDLGDLLD